MNNSNPQPYSPGVQSPQTEPTPEKPPFSLRDWENLIGGKWALWVGSLCLFLAVSSFMPRTWAIVPPWAKVAMGLCSGFALMVVGGFLRNRTQRYFSEGLSGAGLSICYLSLWAGAQYFSVIPLTLGFVGMAFLTATGVILALRYDAISLSILSTLGGFLTPVLLQTKGGPAHATPFLTYILLLNCGILAVSLQKQWRPLVWLSFFCSTILVGNWWFDASINTIRIPTFGFFTAYFLLYFGTSCFYSLVHKKETESEDLLLLFASTSLYSLVGYTLLQPLTTNFPATFPLGLAAFFGAMTLVITQLAPRNTALRTSTSCLALLGLTIAVPLQLHQSALTIGWATEAAVLLYLSNRLKSQILRRAGQIVWLLTSVPLLADLLSNDQTTIGIFSATALPVAACVLTSSLNAWNAHRHALQDNPDELEDAYTTSSVMGLAWLIGQEIYHYLQYHHNAGAHDWQQQAYFAIATIFGLYALAVFNVGIGWKHELVRRCSLVVSVLAQLLAISCMFSSLTPSGSPFLNYRTQAILIIGATSITIGRLLQTRTEVMSVHEKQVAELWTVTSSCFLLVGATLNIYFGFSNGKQVLSDATASTLAFYLCILWNAASAAYLALGIRWQQVSMRYLALMIGGMAVFAMFPMAIAQYTVARPFLNPRGIAFLSALLSSQFISTLLRRHTDELTPFEQDVPNTLGYTSIFLLLWFLTQEGFESVRHAHGMLGDHWRRWAQMVVSMVWSLFGTLLLIRGISIKAQPLRLLALGLLSLTVLKAFLFDLAFLVGPSRVFCLGGLGISLIFISWLYNRFGSEKTTA